MIFVVRFNFLIYSLWKPVVHDVHVYIYIYLVGPCCVYRDDARDPTGVVVSDDDGTNNI